VLDVVEGEDIDVVGSQWREHRAEFPRRLTCRPSCELDAHDDPFSHPTERRHGGWKRLVVRRSLGLRAPVQEVHAALDRSQDVVGSDRGVAVRGEAETADGLAEFLVRARQER
jgi:hypothetical protein